MKSLDRYYAADDLERIARTLTELARDAPNTPRYHSYLNLLRVGVKFGPAQNHFQCYVGAPQTYPRKADFTSVQNSFARFARGGVTPLEPREYLHHGVIYYANGFAWQDEYAYRLRAQPA